MPEKIPTTVTYLEITDGSFERKKTVVSGSHFIEKITKPSYEFYIYLYDRAGATYNWTARKLMPKEELLKSIHDEQVEIFALIYEGKIAGYVELDFREEAQAEVAYFGIFPEFQGLRLGPLLLNWATDYAWSKQGFKRLWVHTCTLDHPKALSVYQRAGFKTYKTETEYVDPLPESYATPSISL